MGDKDRQGSHKPGQGGNPQGGRESQGGKQKPGQGGRESQGGGDKPTTRPTPSGVPNEGRSTAGSVGRHDQGVRTGKGDYEVTGGRQGPGEIPNPEDQNDRGSRSGFDGNAAEQVATNPNSRTRQTNQSPSQRRVSPSDDETR